MATPHLVQRLPGLIEMQVLTNPVVATYRFEAQKTLDAAFTGTTTMFNVPAGASFRSPTLRRTDLGRAEESGMGLTRAALDITDYASANIPGDGAIAFLRLREIDRAGVVGPRGPILVVPPAEFFSSAYRTLTLTGTAPAVNATTTTLPPSGAMVLTFPAFVDGLTIYNDEAANPMYVALGAGVPEIEIEAGESMTLANGGTALYLRGANSTSTAAFRLTATVISGLR